MICVKPESLIRVHRLLSAASYRPGWTITAHPFPCHPHEVWLYINAEVVDAEDHSKTVDINVRTVVPTLNPHDFYEWLGYRLRWIEIHESREFYLVHGFPWDSPHAEEQKCKCDYRVRRNLPKAFISFFHGTGITPQPWGVTRCRDNQNISSHFTHAQAVGAAWSAVRDDDLAKSRHIIDKLK